MSENPLWPIEVYQNQVYSFWSWKCVNCADWHSHFKSKIQATVAGIEHGRKRHNRFVNEQPLEYTLEPAGFHYGCWYGSEELGYRMWDCEEDLEVAETTVRYRAADPQFTTVELHRRPFYYGEWERTNV